MVLQAIRGMNDTLPNQVAIWQFLETQLRSLVACYGYQEIRTPILEKTELFKRSIGEVTDIVEKEMYTFLDRNQDSLTLRPEGTASCVRAGIEHGLFYNQIQKLWYLGPIFRHERPQKGRYRQFYQFGVEAVGCQGPEIDAELILMSARLWKQLGLTEALRLEINSLGTTEMRAEYRTALVAYFQQHLEILDADSQRRLISNPLRILDSKNPEMQTLIQSAPQLSDFISGKSLEHFERLQALLKDVGVSFTINPRLVRGLDYYGETVFEWVTHRSAAQNTVCAGGRYDGLIAMLGGHETPAVGFALGVERLIELMQEQNIWQAQDALADIFMILPNSAAQFVGMRLIEFLHDQLPHLKILAQWNAASFKSQFKQADKSGARVALILGEEELQQQQVSIKFLREDLPQVTISQGELANYLKALLPNYVG